MPYIEPTGVDDLVEAIRQLDKADYQATVGNLSEQLGFGSNPKDDATLHRLLADAIEQGIVRWSWGEYRLVEQG